MKYLIILSCLAVFFTPHFSLAADNTDYNLLAPLPLSGARSVPSTTTTAAQYLPGIIKLVIAVAGAFAVLKIMMAGIKYMTTDAMTGKGDARKGITSALWGLLLISSAWLILHTINPRLVEFSLTLPTVEQGPAIGNSIGEAPSPETNVTAKTDLNCPQCIFVYPGIAPDDHTYPYNGIPFPSKNPGEGCLSTYGKCYVDGSLSTKLTSLANNLQKKNIDWWVTEMLPPTSEDHISECHYLGSDKAGRCVDAALIKTAANYNGPCVRGAVLKNFLQAINDSVGPNFQYEITGSESSTCYTQYTTSPNAQIIGGLVSKIKAVGGKDTNVQHAHINY